jgi:hypothetical protein
MTSMRGVCTNFGSCNNADQKTPLDIPPGAEFKCPECNLGLSQSAQPGMSSRTRMLLAAAGVVLVVVIAGAGVKRLFTNQIPVPGPDTTFTPGSDTAQGVVPMGEPAPGPGKGDSPNKKTDKSVTTAPPHTEPGKPPVAKPQPQPREIAKPDTAKPKAPEPPKDPAPTNTDTRPPVAIPAAPAPVPPAPAAVTLDARAKIEAQLTSEICEEASRVGDAVQMQLATALTLSDGTTVPVGSTVTGKISNKTMSQPPLIEIEANALSFDGKLMPIVTNPFSFYMQRPSIVGGVVKGAVIGAAAGAAVGFLLRQNVVRAAGVGAVLGGGAGAAVGAHAQACVSSKDTHFAFTTTKIATLLR